jgi:hypothetical protein
LVLPASGDPLNVEGIQPGAPIRLRCCWTYDDELSAWDTECGECFVCEDGSPHENKMLFCSFCGGKLVERKRDYD